MSRRPKRTNPELTPLEAIMGDERAAGLEATVTTLVGQVAALEEQMRSQYTSIAAYVAIAQEQVDFARKESRADLDRTKQQLVELVEHLRGEMHASAGLRTAGSAPGALRPPEASPAMDRRVADVEAGLTACFDRQRQLADTLAAMLDMLAPSHHDERTAIVGLSLV